MTKRECAIVMAYTGVCMLAGEDLGIFYRYLEERLNLGRPIWTHEIPFLEEEIRKRSEADFMRLCETATEE